MDIYEFLSVLDAIRYETELDGPDFQELKQLAVKYHGKIRDIVDLMESIGLMQ